MNESSVLIKAIDKGTVHRICSGQVVLNLAIAVKELIENSIDAGATSIQIKLDDYGSESVEVIDNGCGVEEVNFQALTLKHHTSKISDFDDVYSVETFGFRGEALSSLCALSEVTITTQHKSAVIGTTIKFDHQGNIVNTSKTLRQTGTTVKLKNLFCTLPIRRTEFLKNLKREFSKMCNILYAYGLQTTGVRITCTNHISKTRTGNKDSQEDVSKQGTITTVMDTKGDSIESNIRSIFGLKQKQNLVKVVEKMPTETILSEFGLQNKTIHFDKFQFEGYISSCAHGCGRNSSDRQFYYINSRPIDNPKIAKLINEVYHQYNNRQDPFVVLNIKVALGSFDVNVTPDKRQILIQNEKILLAILKQSLLNTFQDIPCTMEMHNVGIVSNQSDFQLNRTHSDNSSGGRKKEIFTKGKTEETSLRMENLLNFKRRSSTYESIPIKAARQSNSITEYFQRDPDVKSCDQKMVAIVKPEPLVISNSSTSQKHESVSNNCIKVVLPEIEMNPEIEGPQNLSNIWEKKFKVTLESTSDCKRNLTESDSGLSSDEKTESKRMKIDDGLTLDAKRKRNVVTFNINIEKIKKMILKEKDRTDLETKTKTEEVKFLAEIKPKSNERAETELKKVIKKESFANMKIIGQFNLGFIITQLDSDVFIIDQHASDEKYNFECIRSKTVIQSQTMVNPETLELTVDKEELMVQREQVFKKNGFAFVFDETGVPTRRIKLTRVPLSKNITFGKEDVDELLFLLEDAPEDTMLRPPRVEKMYASRACRKSVMIGTALNTSEMRKIVNHMGEIDHPWNCPHGRPTMRHLVNLHMICLNK